MSYTTALYITAVKIQRPLRYYEECIFFAVRLFIHFCYWKTLDLKIILCTAILLNASVASKKNLIAYFRNMCRISRDWSWVLHAYESEAKQIEVIIDTVIRLLTDMRCLFWSQFSRYCLWTLHTEISLTGQLRFASVWPYLSHLLQWPIIIITFCSFLHAVLK